MTRPGDHGPEMSRIWLADDDAIEAIVRGDEVSDHLAPLAVFARGVRAVEDEQGPSASAALAALFVPAPKKRRRGSGAATALGKVAGLSLLAKIGLGTSVAAATVASGAAGVLPEPATGAVRGAIELITSVEFHDSGPAAPEHPVPPAIDSTVEGDEIQHETPGTSPLAPDEADDGDDDADEQPHDGQVPPDDEDVEGDDDEGDDDEGNGKGKAEDDD